MESGPKTEAMGPAVDIDAKNDMVDDRVSDAGGTVIHIDPKKEAAARRKFDKFLLPVSLVFIILSALDRNNVSLRMKSLVPLNPIVVNQMISSEMLESSGSTPTSDSRAASLVTSKRCPASVPFWASSLGP